MHNITVTHTRVLGNVEVGDKGSRTAESAVLRLVATDIDNRAKDGAPIEGSYGAEFEGRVVNVDIFTKQDAN